jgi:hypothetical protein
VAHNVHLEIPLEWLARNLDFLERRGDVANDALYRLHRARYADARETIFNVQCTPLPEGEGPGVKLSGRVLTDEQHVQLRAALAELPVNLIDDQTKVLLTDATPWALVKRSVSDVRRTHDGLAEQVTQILISEAVRVLEDRGFWRLIRAERDGYIG